MKPHPRRRGHKRSIIAVAHKLLRTMFFMIKRGQYYRDCATDYEALPFNVTPRAGSRL